MEGTTGSTFLLCLLCLISLTSANDIPTIDQSLYRVWEDTPVGHIAFDIKATDDNQLTYSISGTNAAFFRVNPENGSVTVARPLDRETIDVMELDATVTDRVNAPVEKLLNIILLDANDNRPVFQQASYDISIPENTTVGSSLFKVVAIDDDTANAGVVQYSIDEVEPESGRSLFTIVSTTGVVKLNGTLDYNGLSTFYRLRINATDGGGRGYIDEIKYHSSIVFSFVTIVDVADLDPQFFSQPYVGKVEENSPLGLSVFKVTATDQDKGVNDQIIFTIENSTADGLFNISQDKGIISVASAIDRELVGDTVTLTVKATESKENIHGEEASAFANVLINIIDLNDNKPEFLKCGSLGDELSCVPASHFTGEVFEHSRGSISFNMTVRDEDSNKFANTKLTLEGPYKAVFSVEPESTVSQSTVQLLVKQPDELDFEKIKQMEVQVIATDQMNTTFQSTATVTIIIKDTNDNTPTFPQDTYMLTVAEHSPVGTMVANITAEDPDTMDQNITYKLLPASIGQYFGVERHAGVVYVKNQTLLDREVRPLYTATLQAMDTGGNQGSTALEITVTDINDNPPVMNRDSYQAFVNEGGKFTLKIEATDADEPDTNNSRIVYAIEPSRYSDNFTIDPSTGVLTNVGMLDREDLDPELDGKIELNVTATDQGSPQLSSVVLVTINVQDINDNEPEFESPSYKFSVKEGEKGTFVGSVFAEDRDQTQDFNRISFSIVNGGFGSFIIRSFAAEGRGPGVYGGNITVDPDIQLDFESARKRFTLRVEAADLGQKKALVSVDVEVLDVNDERPWFEPTEPVRVSEETAVDGAVGRFRGRDLDGNHSLVYSLVSMRCVCHGEPEPCHHFILRPDGEVFVNPDDLVDYEECTQALIEAQVEDRFTEKGENNSAKTGVMVIDIEDINDNAPEFIYSDSVFVVVSESASKGTSVAGVTATDRDSGVNREIVFKVTAVQFRDADDQITNMRTLFEAVTTQQKDLYVGIIQTTEGLDMTLKGKYLVTVNATDTGGLSNSTVLEIFTVDESYKVELEFTSSQAEVEKNLNEIVRALTAATKTAVEIVAIRPDTPAASRVTGNTIIVAYFVYSNGTALTSTEVEKMLSDPEHYLVLGQLGLKNIGKAPVLEADEDPVKYVLLGMVAGLLVVLAILTTSLMCTRRNYRRKLKAAKAMNSASMVTSANQKSGPVVPGTNKYTMEGANPVLNLNMDTAMVLPLDEESDVDKVSLNSLDCSYDMIIPPKETKNMMMIQEEEVGGHEYIEPLGEALARRGQNRGPDMNQGFVNPAFSTSEL